MSLSPGYGETPVPGDELLALLPQARDLLGEPVTKAAVYDLEQGIQAHTAEELLIAVMDGVGAISATGTFQLDDSFVLNGVVGVQDLLTDHFLRALHNRLYDEVWTWAGVYRTVEMNVGVAPQQIAIELRATMDNLLFRWQETDDWTPRELGIAAHAEGVRIHPFTDGNGRTTRLLADLVFAAAQDPEALGIADPLFQYDWDVDKARYIQLLREYDRHRDPRELAAFVPLIALGG